LSCPLHREVEADTPLQKALRTRLAPEFQGGEWAGRIECREKGCSYSTDDMENMERHLGAHARPQTVASYLGLKGNAYIDGAEL